MLSVIATTSRPSASYRAIRSTARSSCVGSGLPANSRLTNSSAVSFPASVTHSIGRPSLSDRYAANAGCAENSGICGEQQPYCNESPSERYTAAPSGTGVDGGVVVSIGGTSLGVGNAGAPAWGVSVGAAVSVEAGPLSPSPPQPAARSTNVITTATVTASFAMGLCGQSNTSPLTFPRGV